MTLRELAAVFDAFWKANDGLWTDSAATTTAASYLMQGEADRLAGIFEDVAAVAMAAEPKTEEDITYRFHIIARFSTMVSNADVNQALADALRDLPVAI